MSYFKGLVCLIGAANTGNLVTLVSQCVEDVLYLQYDKTAGTVSLVVFTSQSIDHLQVPGHSFLGLTGLPCLWLSQANICYWLVVVGSSFPPLWRIQSYI